MLSVAPLHPAHRRHEGQGGFSLIELMIGIAVVAIAMSMAVPSFSLWMKNARIRASAETVQNALQFARTEAVRRNQIVRFQIVDTLTSACVLSTTGSNWVTTLDGSSMPEGDCGNTISDSTTPFLLQKGPIFNADNVTLTASATVYAFNGLGTQGATTNPTTTPPSALSIQFNAAQGSCLKDGGEVRCLNVTVSPGGQIRMCDPSQTSATDPMKC